MPQNDIVLNKSNSEKWKRKYLLVAGIFLLLIILVTVNTTAKVLSFESTNWTEDFHGDCGLVFTGGMGRIREGIDLLARGSIKKLIISGVHPQSSFSDIFQEYPFYASVNTENVVLEKRSTTTYGNVQQSIPLLEALNCKEIILITSRIHMYRSMSTLQASLPKEMHVKVDAVYTGEGRVIFTEVVDEIVKSLFYRIWAF